MESANKRAERTLYCLLQIHPGAPLDLISAAYWRLAAQAQAARKTDRAAEQRLNELTSAYRTLADSSQRRRYDESIALETQSIAPLIASTKRSAFARLMRRKTPERPFNHYELLRVDPSASSAIVDEAYPIIRGYYLRLVRVGEEPTLLLDLLEEAYAVLSDPVRRMAYDSEIGYGQVPVAVPFQPTDIQGQIAADG